MVTRDDVASCAGTSTAVVSYVVNGGPRRVSAATRVKVLRAIEELGYRPNGLARALKMHKTFTIGLIVPDNTNPFFAQLARAVEEAAFARGYVLLLGNSSQDDVRQSTYVKTFLERRVDGLVLIVDSDVGDGCMPAETIKALQASGIPLVLLDRQPNDLGARSVSVDNKGGGYLATKHLLEHGHATVACLAGPADLMVVQARTEGWVRALRESGAQPDDRLLVRSPFRRDAGYAVALKLLTSRHRPTAIFAQSDELGISILRAASEAGLAVPRDLAVVSFDGIDESRYTTPPLSTVVQPVDKLGERAVELLLQLGAGSAGDDGRAVSSAQALDCCLPVELAVRRSCGCR